MSQNYNYIKGCCLVNLILCLFLFLFLVIVLYPAKLGINGIFVANFKKNHDLSYYNEIGYIYLFCYVAASISRKW